MAKAFKGEYVNHYQDEKEVKSMKWWEKVLAVSIFILPLLAFLFLFTLHISAGVKCLMLSFVYIPIALKVIFRKMPMAIPVLLVGIGVVGMTIMSVISRYGLTRQSFGYLILSLISVIFLGAAICVLSIGYKRNAKKRRFSIPVMATVVDINGKNANLGSFSEVVHPMQRTHLISPKIQYVVNGVTYYGETNSYYGHSQVPGVGEQLQIYVNPDNHNEYLTQLQSGSLYILTGWVFIGCVIFTIVLSTFIFSMGI